MRAGGGVRGRGQEGVVEGALRGVALGGQRRQQPRGQRERSVGEPRDGDGLVYLLRLHNQVNYYTYEWLSYLYI